MAAIQPPLMEKKPRRQYSPEEKVRILRLHLLEGKAVSEICEREGIHPTLFYQWQRTFFENGSAAFSSPRSAPWNLRSHAGASPAGRIRRFATESDVRNEAVRPKPQAGHRLNRQAITKVNPI